MWIKFLKETKRCVLLSFLAFKDTTLESTSRTFYCFFHCNSKRHYWCQKLVFFISGNTLIGDLHYANIRQTFFNERLPREGVLNHASKKFHRKKLNSQQTLLPGINIWYTQLIYVYTWSLLAVFSFSNGNS